MTRDTTHLLLGVWLGINLGFVLGCMWYSLFSPSPSPEARDQ